MDQQPSRVVMPFTPPTTQPVAPQTPLPPIQQTIAATPTVASPNSSSTDMTSIKPKSTAYLNKVNQLNQYSDYL